MPNTQSAKKALRQNITRRARNAAKSKNLKDSIKKYKKAPSKESLSIIYKKLDKAAKIKLIKKNKAARLKSRLSMLQAKS